MPAGGSGLPNTDEQLRPPSGRFFQFLSLRSAELWGCTFSECPADCKATAVKSYDMRVLIFWLVILMLGCSGRTSEKDAGNAGDTNMLGNDSNWTAKRTIALNLPRINHGVDSFELRLWSSFSMLDLQSLITLRYSDGQWHYTESIYWIGKIDEWGKNMALWVDSVQTKRIFSTIPYESILDSIQRYSFWDMPSQQDIPDFVDRTADGVEYILEVAGRERYKSITYRNPQKYSDTFNRQFNSLLEFLSKSIKAFVIP